eukprot:15935-Rhodomonas_salina.1
MRNTVHHRTWTERSGLHCKAEQSQYQNSHGTRPYRGQQLQYQDYAIRRLGAYGQALVVPVVQHG